MRPRLWARIWQEGSSNRGLEVEFEPIVAVLRQAKSSQRRDIYQRTYNATSLTEMISTGPDVLFTQLQKQRAWQPQNRVKLGLKRFIVQLESHWTPLSFIRDDSCQFYIFKSNMPQLMRSTPSNATKPTVVKVTPEQLMALIRQGKTGSLKPSTLTLSDSGEHIIRPVLLPLSH